MQHIKSQHLLVFCLVCLVAIGIYSPFAIANGNIYMGMLIGYIQAKTNILSSLNSDFGERMVRSYLSLRYEHGISSTNHDGITILAINASYFATLTTLIYILIKRIGYFSHLKAVTISLLITGTIIILVGANTLASAPNLPVSFDKTNPYHMVRQGDTCEKIAFNYNVSTESLIKRNKLSASCDLSVGDLLVIPLSEP
jgi:LysM repeat protein